MLMNALARSCGGSFNLNIACEVASSAGGLIGNSIVGNAVATTSVEFLLPRFVLETAAEDDDDDDEDDDDNVAEELSTAFLRVGAVWRPGSMLSTASVALRAGGADRAEVPLLKPLQVVYEY